MQQKFDVSMNLQTRYYFPSTPEHSEK